MLLVFSIYFLANRFSIRVSQWIILISLSLAIPLSAEPDSLFRINKLVNGNTYHWGIMDISGTVKISPRFEGLGEFTDNVALAQLNKKWGVINKKGEFIRKPEFQDVRQFENGLAWVIQNCTYWLAWECERGKWGLINQTGEIIIQPKYDGVSSVEAPYVPRLFGRPSGELHRDRFFWDKDGYARVYTESNDPFNRIRKYGIVDRNGKEIIPPNFHKIDFFQNDIAPFSQNNGKGIFYGLIHASGEILIEANTYKSIISLVPFEDKYSEVIWAASYYDKDKHVTLIKLLKKDGEEISPIRLHQIHPFKEGLALARETHTAKWGILDRNGNWNVEPTYKSYRDAFPEEEKKRKNLLEINGKRFYKDANEDFLWFSETEVDPYDKEERGFWNYSDLEGNNVVYCKSFERGYFSEGVSWISLRYRKKGNEHIIYLGLINEQGKELVPPIYLNALPFRNGLGAAQVFGGNWGYVNKQGKVVWWMK